VFRLPTVAEKEFLIKRVLLIRNHCKLTPFKTFESLNRGTLYLNIASFGSKNRVVLGNLIQHSVQLLVYYLRSASRPGAELFQARP
jgi:hypothetical protein